LNQQQQLLFIQTLLIMKNQIQTEIVTAQTAQQYKVEMLDLYATYYDVDREAFFNRFASNDHYVIYKASERVVGFTGIRLKTVATPTRKAQTIYLGQTVMHEDFRGRSLIPRTCTRLIARTFLRHPFRPIFIWCDSLTYKPYLLFANSLCEYYPSRHHPTVGEAKYLMDHLGSHNYGDNYDPETGTVFKSQNVINDVTAVISPAMRQNPDIDFFATANPNYTRGHGLLTLTPMHWKNFLYLVKKCIRKALQSSPALPRTAPKRQHSGLAL
jgi:hypothetical protein